MGDVVRLVSPKFEKLIAETAENAKLAIIETLKDEDDAICYTDMTVSLARTVYTLFYEMAEKLNPGLTCEEIDFFLELMNKNLPVVKKNLWQDKKEEPNEKTI